MGFLTIVRKLREKEKTMKLLTIGLDNAGKTTIIKRFNGEDIDDIAPTLGFDINTLARAARADAYPRPRRE